MSYASNSDLPVAIINALPDEAQTTWREIVDATIGENNDEKTAFATAWAGLRKQGWEKNKSGMWEQIKKDNLDSSSVHVNVPIDEKKFIFKIAETNIEKRLAFGWSVVSRDAQGYEVWDLQDDGIDPIDLEDLAYKYVRFYRDSGELHINAGKAVLIESVVTTLEKQRVWGVPSGVMPVGWWTGFYVIDDGVWEKVKNGEYSAFSIEGTAIRQKV